MNGERLDRALATAVSGMTRGEARRLISAGVVFVSGKRTGICSRVVRTGDAITWQAPAEISGAAGVEIKVLLERPGYWIVDKPSGMPVEPTRGGKVGTLVDVMAHQMGAVPFVTHRLDTATSGLLIVARTKETQAELNGLFAIHAIARRYLAVVSLNAGTNPPGDELMRSGRLTIDRPLDGKPAVTHATVVARSDFAAALVVDLETGRTRQIRRHLAEAGYPVVGESASGQRTGGRLMLHAYRMSLPSRFRDGARDIRATCPTEFRSRMVALGVEVTDEQLESVPPPPKTRGEL